MVARSALVVVVFSLSLVACNDEAEKAVAQGPASPATQDDHHPGEPPEAANGTKTALGKGETPAERDQVDDDGVVRRGTELPTTEKVSVSDCVKRAGELDGRKVLVEGKVAKVCAKKGCWWTIQNPEDPTQTIRVTHDAYGFFVPRTAEGKAAMAYGVLEVKKLSPEEAAHILEDEGVKVEDPSKLPTVELRLVASALEMRG